jgi:hypothetical protein
MTDTVMTPEAAIADGSPDAAGKALDALVAKYRGPAPSATPGDSIGAKARLSALAADPDWSKAFFSGDQAARAEFTRLTAQVAAGNPTADALAGAKPSETFELETTVAGQLNTRNRADAVAGLRELGLGDDVVAQAIDGASVSPHEVAMARQAKAMRLSDKAWTDRYLAGGIAEKREMGLLNVILSGVAA